MTENSSQIAQVTLEARQKRRRNALKRTGCFYGQHGLIVAANNDDRHSTVIMVQLYRSRS